MFSPGLPSGFSMYESGDGGRGGARGRAGAREKRVGVTACRRVGVGLGMVFGVD